MRNFFFYFNISLKYSLLCFILLFYYSCDDRTLVINPQDSYTYQFEVFKLNQNTSNSLRIEDFNSGLSPYLYSGSISDSLKSYSIIKITPDILDQNLFCQDTTILEVNDVKLRLMTLDVNEENSHINYLENSLQNSIPDNEIMQPENDFLVSDYIKAYFISENDLTDFNENSSENHTLETVENVESLIDNGNLLPIDFFYNEPPYNVTTLYIDITDLYGLNNENLKNAVCDNMSDFYILIDYLAVSLVSTTKNIEFYSSDYVNTFLNPALFINYNVSSISIDKINKYSIMQINSNAIDNTDYIYLSDVDNDLFGTILSFDIPGDNFELNDMDSTVDIVGDSLSILLSASNQTYNLFDVDIELNQDYLDSISDIRFFFNDVYFAFNDLDPSNDNWNNLDSLGSEGNQLYDIGEIFQDLGYDNCPDQYETGNFIVKCDSSENFIPIYNPEGTEGNMILDWTDSGDLNELWDEGEGERWYDYGEDNCKDNNELGNGNCLSEEAITGDVTIELICNEQTNLDSLISLYGEEISSFDISLCDLDNYDLNNDNQNRDPSEDDYICTEWNNDYTECFENNNNKENNNIYDLGEPFLDFGIDQIPDSLEAFAGSNYPNDNWNEIDSTGTENNGIYDLGEIFFDTGLDGLFSYQESGYNYYGKENNYSFDYGYEFFDDFGTDNIEDGNDQDSNDNYLLDPNSDSNLENNGLLDFDDIGLDRCIDDYELGNGNCLSDAAISGNVNVDLLCNPNTDIDALITLYGDEIATFDFNLCLDNISDLNEDNWSEENNDGTEGNMKWDWIDSDEDNIFNTENDIHELTEYWEDLGVDGLVDSLEANYGNNYAIHSIENNIFNLNLEDFNSIGDSILLDSMILDENSNNEVSMWISKILKINEDAFKLSIELMSNIDILGMQFQLDHEYIYNVIDTIQTSSRSFYPHQFNDSNDNLFPDQDELIEDSEKYIQDFSLYKFSTFEEDSLFVYNANGIVINLDFEDFDLFVENSQNSIIANDQTQLVLYINNQNNFDNDIDLYFEIFDENEDDFIIYEGISPYRVIDDSDSLLINIGPLIQKYLYNETIFNPDIGNGIRIKIGDYSNNLSNITFVKDDISKSPRLEVFYKNEN